MSVMNLKQRGDTIVEVMLVLTILGLAISIAYSTANRSLLNARQAQENSEATELVQAQVEVLRSLVPSDPTDTAHFIYRPNLFCVDIATSTVVNLTSNNPNNYGSYPVNCVKGFYHLSVNWSGAGTDTFTVQAVYDDALGQGQDTVTLEYRIHKV